MIFHNLLGSVLYRVVTYLVIVSMLGTSIPIIRELPRATAAYLGMMQQLGLLEPDPYSPVGVRPVAPEGMEGLTMPTIGNDGEPVGFLLNAEAFEFDEADFEPPALADPISVSRVQSAYAATDALSQTLAITFTITNNRPPAIAPPVLPVTATITDTIEAMAAIDFSNDPNVIHNVLLADDLLPPSATFLSTDPMPDRDGDSMAFNLGNIPPLGSITATLKVQIPASVSAFTDLDSGATAWGTLSGRMVSASTAPARLAPDDLSEWLIWTVDADYYDEYMVPQASELGNDWQQMFAYVRSLGYESYKGSLRGTRGTLWSEAGNSLDQASLLIAMLRGSSIPARYRHGTLSTERAQELILSMFPERQGTIGHIPPGTEVADPANDPQLLAETVDHWWVEAYLPGLGWRDLDPCFADADLGDVFVESVASDGTDRIAEAPDEERHKVTMTVKVERWDRLTNLNGGLEYTYPLSYTFNTVELVGEPVTLGHMVNTDAMAGMTFWRVQHTYVPYFVVGDWEEAYEGESFQDVLSNFPFGNFLTTGEWLLFDVRDADGNVEHYEREIVDLVGFESRQAGGTVDIGQNVGQEPVVSTLNTYTFHFAASRVPTYAASQSELDKINYFRTNCTFLDGDGPSRPKDELLLRNCVETGRTILAGSGKMLGQNFLYYSTSFGNRTAATYLTRSYNDKPQIVIAAHEVISSSLRVSIDLQSVTRRVLPEPGQAQNAGYAVRFLLGLQDTALESEILKTWVPEHVISAKEVIDIATANGTPLAFISGLNLDELDTLPISMQAKARITSAVQDGKVVVVPTQMVIVNGMSAIAWLETDEQGNTIGVGENGMHDATFYLVMGALAADVLLSGALWGCIGFFGTLLIGLIVYLSTPVCSDEAKQYFYDRVWAFQEAMLIIIATLAGIRVLSLIGACLTIPGWALGGMTVPACVGAAIISTAVVAGKAVLAFWGGVYLAKDLIDHRLQALGLDPPLSSCRFRLPAYNNELRRMAFESNLMTRSIFAPHSLNYKHANGNLNTASTWFTSTAQTRWASAAHHSSEFLAFRSEARIYNSNGTLLDTGTIVAEPRCSSATVVMHTIPFAIAHHGTGDVGLYSPSLSGIGAGTDWNHYTVTLTSTQPYTLTLFDTIVTVNDTNVYTGDFTLAATNVTTIEGFGPGAAPNFAPLFSSQIQDAHLMIGPASGFFQVGDEIVDISNGLAIANYTGLLTVSEETTLMDRVEFEGNADLFTLRTSPAASTTDPNSPVSFQAVVEANFDDTYTMTIEAPRGWTVELDVNGLATVLPPLGTEPGNYIVLVTAQSSTYSGLFASAEHVVTTTAYQGMEMDVAPDPLITVPFGPKDPNALPGDTNNGQVQLPGAAFTVNITNTSTVEHTFEVEVTGLPEGWLVLSGAEGETETTVSLPAGGIGQVGLYISPTLTTLPPVHTDYPFDVDVTATDYPALQETDSDVFTIPAIPFNHVTTDPLIVYATPGGSANFDLSVKNVGNVSGTFPVTVTLPITTWILSNLPSPVSNLPAGETSTQEVTFSPIGSALGDDEIIRIESPAPGTAYTQTAYVFVRIAGPCVVATHKAAQAAVLLDDAPLSTALANLTSQLQQWEGDPADTVLRDRTVAALNDVIGRLQATYPLVDTSDLEALAASPTIAGFCGPMADLEDQLTAIAQHDVAFSLRPGFDATLVDHPITYTLTLKNEGTLTTTYVTDLQSPISTLQSPFTVTLSPGQVLPVPVALTPTTLGYHTIEAEVQAVEAEMIHRQANAGLNSVDRFVQVLSVRADPDFVELGPNSVDLYAQVANVAGIRQYGQAQVSVLAPDGTAVYTNTTPVALIPSVDVQGVDLGTASAAGWGEGVYTVTVDIVDPSGDPIPNGSGYGHLVAGEGVKVSAGAWPAVVVPGTVTVTTAITAERTAPVGVGPGGAFNNQYTFYMPKDIRRPCPPNLYYGGFYVVGLRPQTTYVVQRFDTVSNTWTHLLTNTVTMDELNLHFDGLLADHLYRVYASEPLLVVVSSGEGSLVSAATHDLDFRGRHFIFLGDYDGFFDYSRVAVFGLEDSTTFTVEVRAYESDWTIPLATITGTLDADGYSFHEIPTGENTTVFRVTSDKDVIVYRTGNDNDELDTAISENGTPYGKVFYFAPVPYVYNNVLLLFNTEPLTANVTVYGLDTSYVSTATLEPYGAQTVWVAHQAEYFKIVSDRTLSVVGGGDGWWQLYPDGANTDAIWEIMPTPMGELYLYQTNLLYARNKPLDRKYTEFQANAMQDTEIATSIQLIDKSTHRRWHDNGLDYLASEPFTVTLEVISRTIPTGIFRHEEDYDIHYTPAPWTQHNHTRVSRGDYAGTNVRDATAYLDFQGTWVSVGFLTRINGGLAEVFIDGVSQGIVDTYGHSEDVKNVTYSGLTASTHTISITVLRERNDFSHGYGVNLDYIDTWDGTAMAEGVFEEDDENKRVVLSSNWEQVSDTDASGGAYIRRGSGAWFLFTGDSVTYQALANDLSDKIEILVDGVSLGFFDLFSQEPVTRTFSFDSLGPGPHVLYIKQYRGWATVDAFVTPGIPPFYEPPERTGIVRYEEDDPALRYNGFPFQQANVDWSMQGNSRLSEGCAAMSKKVSDTVSLTFGGTWVGAGFWTRGDGGEAEVFIDGFSQGTVDTYSNGDDVKSVYYSGLATGTHTISITVHEQNRPVFLDYIDVWDGTAMAGGTFEEDDDRLFHGLAWRQHDVGVASGGSCYRHGVNSPSNAWFPFTDSSVTYQAVSYDQAGKVEILIDGVGQGFFDLYNPIDPATYVTRTFSFDDLGAGPHVMQVKAYRGVATVDTFTTPGIPPFYEPPERSGVVRYEEDDPAMRYNGLPFQQANADWDMHGNVRLSEGYAAMSRKISDTISLTFEGPWVGVGFWTRYDGGWAYVYVDGVLSDTVNTFSNPEDVMSVYYMGLSTGTHTISITVHEQNKPVFVDYVDVWDGTAMAGGTFEEDDDRVSLSKSTNWRQVNYAVASGDTYMRGGYNVWFRFTGDSITYQALAHDSASQQAEVLVDGVSKATISLYADVSSSNPITCAFTFDSLGVGPHVMQVKWHERQLTVDAFTVPGGGSSASTSSSTFALAPMPAAVASRFGHAPALPSTSTPTYSGHGKPLAALWPIQGPAPAPAQRYQEPPQDEGVDVDLVLDGAPPFQTLSHSGIHTITLPAGRHSFDLIADRGDVVLKGFTLNESSSLVWNLHDIPDDAVHPSGQTFWENAPFWTFTSNAPFQFLQGGWGNCWIHTMLPYQYGESYQLQIDHRVPLAGVQPLTGTFSPPPITTTIGTGETAYVWQHEMIPSQQVYAVTFDSKLTDMQPGEVRQISNGTLFEYTTLGGQGQGTLPPIYVTTSHLVALDPLDRTTNPGGRAAFEATLYNPQPTADTFILTLEGLPAGWTFQPIAVLVGAGAEVIVPVAVNVPTNAALGEYVFAAVVETGSGSRDAVQAQVTVADLVEITSEPSLQGAGHGETVTYTLSIANREGISRTYTLAVDGLGDNVFNLPATLEVAAGASTTATLQVTALAPRGLYLFRVTAAYETPEQAAQAGAEATLLVLSEPGVAVALAPSVATGGRGSPAVYTTTVTNVGSLADTYDLAVGVPAGWSAELSANDAPVHALTLTPHVFNAAPLQLLVIPAVDTVPGVYTFTVTAASQTDASTFAVAVGTTIVSQYGVTVQITPQSTAMDPQETQSWDVLVTNTGIQPDTFDLVAGGIVSGTAQFDADPVALSAGDSTVVELTAGPLEFALPQTYPFAVTARSRGDDDVFGYDTAEVTFTDFEAVGVGVLPISQTVSDTLQASYLMIITNTGNVDTVYAFSASGDPALGLELEVDEVYIPPHMAAGILVTAKASAAGTYAITLQADSTTTGSTASDSAVAILTIVTTNEPPVVEAGSDQTVDEGELVYFAGSFTDPDAGDTHTIEWAFGDGGTVSGTLTPTHVYADDGVYTVTLTVSDDGGAVGSDALMVTVHNVAPEVDAGPDRTVNEGTLVGMAGSFTDPGLLDTHVVEWDLGDGAVITGALVFSHIYADNGVYTVTLTVSDDDGGVGSDMRLVTVNNVAPHVYAGPDQAANKGEGLVFTGTFADPGTLDTHTIQWDFGDGTTADGTLTTTHVYTASGSYTVTLTISDDDGGVGSDTLLVTVSNAPPEVDAGPDQAVDEGEEVSFNGSFSDPDEGDTHVITWDFGDGSMVANTLTPTHVYTAAGVYTVTLIVTDDEGAVGSDTLLVTVTDVGPAVSIEKVATPTSLPEPGGAFTFTLAITNESVEGVTITALTDDNPLSAECQALVGATLGVGESAACEYAVTHANAGSYANTATVTVEDNEENPASASDSATVVVTDVEPAVSIEKTASPTSLPEPGGAFTFTLTVTNESVEAVTITVLADDNPLSGECQALVGTTLGAGESAACEYAVVHTEVGSYANTATVTVEDNEENPASASDSAAVTVTSIGTCELYPIALHVDTLTGAAVGQEIEDILNGGGSGGPFDRLRAGFGWLSWTGDPSVPALVTSLTPPGDSDTYVNPYNPGDHTLSVGDWVQGKPGVSNAKAVRDALDTLKSITITVPVWDEATGQGSNLKYRVVGYAQVQITDYHLPGRDRISAIFWGYTACGEPCPDAAPIDLLYVLDVSGSMNYRYAGSGTKLAAAQEAILTLNAWVSALDNGSRVALLTFRGTGEVQGSPPHYPAAIELVSGFTEEVAALDAAVLSLKASSSTPTAAALEEVAEWLPGAWNPNHRPVVIVVSDGVPTVDLDQHGFADQYVERISLYDRYGNFLSPQEVRARGQYYHWYRERAGEPLADAMVAIQELKGALPEATVYAVAVQARRGGIFNDDVLRYVAAQGGGAFFAARDAAELAGALQWAFIGSACRPPLPAPWRSQDVGSVRHSGNAVYADGAFIVDGGGANVWGRLDEFHYVYRTLEGDGEIVARVVGMESTHPWAKAGVMMRETVGADSAHAQMVVTAERGLAFQRRTRTGGTSRQTFGSSAEAPYWAKVVRRGNVFTGYVSEDGENWTRVDSAYIGMVGTIHVGLVVTAHDDATLCTARFDHVAVAAGSP